MDTHRHSEDASRQQARSYQSVTSQWSAIPLPYRPLEWTEHDNEQPKLSPPSEYDWRLRPTVSGHATSGPLANSTSPPRARRRPRELRDVPARTSFESDVDYGLLYPQMSPYTSEFGMRSAPVEMQHVAPRSVSQSNSPGYFPRNHDQSDPQPGQVPRSPTYPPVGRRRMHSDTGVQDGAFADEVEFRLFVDATAGLGPEQAFRTSSYQPSYQPIRRPYSWEGITHRSGPVSPIEDRVSPLEETPTTVSALQQLAQMPQASYEPQWQPTRTAVQQLAQLPLPSSEHQRQQMQSIVSGVDVWPAWSHEPTQMEHMGFEEDEGLPDEELPDYASSQAQAQASQRTEAARRAQELQRRWQSISYGRGR